jgi:protein PsiE
MEWISPPSDGINTGPMFGGTSNDACNSSRRTSSVSLWNRNLRFSSIPSPIHKLAIRFLVPTGPSMDSRTMKYENPLQKAIKGRLERAMELAELFGLFIIGIGTIAAVVQLIWRMMNSDGVTLTDLLLMFLYLEVFAMVGQYLKAGQLPVRFPLYIAMVSIARDLILRAGMNTELHLLASAGAIVLIALGVLMIRFGQFKYPSDQAGSKSEETR